MNHYLNTVSPPILPLTLSRLSPCLVSNIGRGVRCVFTCITLTEVLGLSEKNDIQISKIIAVEEIVTIMANHVSSLKAS
jgi:hypothetical protein